MSDRRAGQYLRDRVFWRMVIGFVGLGVVVMLAAMGFAWWPMSLASLALMLYLLWAVGEGRWLDPLPWKQGLLGERAVAQVLEGLPDGYRVLHDLETGRGNVDHVVIGPTGVFALETKHRTGRFYARRGRLYLSGREAEDTRRQAVRGAIWVRERLQEAGLPRLRVEALVVSTKALVYEGELDVRHAKVLDVNALVGHIRGRPARLTPEQVSRAAQALSVPG